MELLEGGLVVIVAVNRGLVAVKLTGTGNGTGTRTGTETRTGIGIETRTGTGTTDLRWYCFIICLSVLLMHPPLLSIHNFYPDDGYLLFCHLIPFVLT